MDRNQTLIDEWCETVNLEFLINDIFADIDTEAHFFGQTLDISAFITNRIFNANYPYDSIERVWHAKYSS